MRRARGQIVILAAATFLLGASGNICAQSRATGSGDAVALNNRGLELYQKGKIDEAAALFRQALAINPDFPEALSNLGMMLDLQGKDDEAIADFDKALAIRPTDG